MNKPLLKPIAMALMLLASSHALAEKSWKINLKDADISALVNEMAEITGKNFVVDPRLKGNVTVISTREMNARELYALFQSVLSINGFAAVETGPIIKIVPDTNARQAGIMASSPALVDDEALVTRVVMLQNANANELMAALRPMMPQSAHLAAVAGANALVMSDRANNIEAMLEVIRDLDVADKDEAIDIIPLQNAKAADLLSVLEVMEASSVGGAQAGKGGKASPSARLIVDERSNRLLVRGDADLRSRVRAIVKNLDEAPELDNDQVRVFRLKFASARQVAEVLKGVLSTGRSSSRSSSSTSTSSTPSTSSSSSTGSNMGSTSLDASSSGGGLKANNAVTTTITVEGASLIADETQNALIVRATAAQIRQVESVLRELDTRRAQVLIQAAIVEVSGDNAAQLGVQWASGDPTTGVGVINFNNAGASLTNIATAVISGNPASAGIANGAAIALGQIDRNSNGDRTFFGALIQALESVSDANLLSTPSIMTLDNQEAKIVVGQNVPFITGSTTTVGSGVTNPFTTIQRQDVGITLKVTPTITDGGTVRLSVEQEVSSVVPSVAGINSSDIITNKRAIQTSILADNGQTIVLGGLVQDDIKTSVSKVPLLGDIPGLGVLFRSTSESRIKRNLLVFLQPTILRSGEQAEQITQRQYGAIRRLDFGLDENGQLIRLPSKVQDVYQGGPQRTPSAPASQDKPQATLAPVATSAPVPVRPVAEKPTPALQPAAVTEEPTTFAAPVIDPIDARPIVNSPSPEPTFVAPAVQAPAPTSTARPTPFTPAESFQPPVVLGDPNARPFGGAAAATSTKASPAPKAVAKPVEPVVSPEASAVAEQPSAASGTGTRRMIRTSSGNIYYVDE